MGKQKFQSKFYNVNYPKNNQTCVQWPPLGTKKSFLIKLRFRLVVDDSNWPLLAGGCFQRWSLTQVWLHSHISFYLVFFPLSFQQSSSKVDFTIWSNLIQLDPTWSTLIQFDPIFAQRFQQSTHLWGLEWRWNINQLWDNQFELNRIKNLQK